MEHIHKKNIKIYNLIFVCFYNHYFLIYKTSLHSISSSSSISPPSSLLMMMQTLQTTRTIDIRAKKINKMKIEFKSMLIVVYQGNL